jgi:hypothetical protein
VHRENKAYNLQTLSCLDPVAFTNGLTGPRRKKKLNNPVVQILFFLRSDDKPLAVSRSHETSVIINCDAKVRTSAEENIREMEVGLDFFQCDQGPML